MPNTVRKRQRRITGRALQRIRELHLSANPLCVKCEERGRFEPATQVDHIKPLHQGGAETEDNRQGLCDACHTEKSKLERGHAYHPLVTIGPDGWPKG